MIITHYQYSAESMLDDKSFEEGALYFIEDTQHVYLDPVGGSERIRIASDINILASEADRENLLAPIPGKMYFVLETSKYYIFYGDTWYAGGGSNKPRAGLIYINPGSSLPEGFLWCDGATYSRSDYPELFAAIGTNYGSGDGSTTFNVPDLTTRVPIGAGGDYKLGQTGGDEEDTIIVVNQSGNTNTVDTSAHLYTVVNYIISTGKDSKTLSVSDLITSMQVLPLGVEYGGTGADNPSTALSNLGGVNKSYVDTSVSNTKTNMTTYTDNSVNNAKNTLTDYIDNKVANIDTGASKEYVDQAIAGIDTGATEQYVDNAVSNLNTDVKEYVDQQIAGINTGASEEYVNNAIQEATENMVVDVPTLQEHLANEDIILSGLQYGTELPDTGVEGQVFFKIITSSSNSNTDSSQNVDLTGYATEQWVQEGFQPKGDYITEAPVQSVNGKTGVVSLSATDVGALPDTYTPPDQTAEQVGADPVGTAITAVSGHDTSTTSHNDIRLLITDLTARLNTLANSTDEDLDQMAELVAYIKSNKSLIEQITTNKVNVTDIVNDLVTNVTNKPLSAAQGVALKAMIDAITIPTKVSAFTNDAGYLTEHQDISGKLDANKLPEAINDALAQAKSSGEFDGEDGVSPTVTVSKSGKVATIKITDKDGTKTVAINDGADGSASVTDGSITPEKTSFIVCEGSGETVSTQVPNFTNLANPKSSDWKTDTRFSTSSGTMSAYTGAIVTNAIHCVAGDVVRIKGIMGGSGSTSSAYFQAVGYKDEAGETKCSSSGVLFEKTISQAGNGVKDIVTVENGVTTWTAYTYQPGVDDGAVQSTGFVGAVSLRIGGMPVGSVDDIIVTINEPITYTEVTSGGKTYTLSEDIVVPHAKAVKSGARWFALGDSITEGWTSAVDTSASSGYKQFKNTNEDERWVNIVAQKNGYEMTNYGVGGTGYYWAANNAKAQVDAIDFSQCDFVTLAYGCNDWKYDGSVIGSEEDLPQTVFASSDGNNSITIDSDTTSDAIVYKNGVLLTPSTDYSISNGYLNLTTNTVKRDCFEIYKSSESMVANMAYCIKKIIRDNPYCKIFAITPINCRSLGTYATNWGVSYTGTAGCGKSLEYVYQMQKVVCEAYGIELIDMTHNSIVNRENIRTMLADYVHPTVECHAVLGRELARKIKFV